MHPQRLYLKNFLSYGAQGTEIDFTPYQTVLLIGANGAGKSSILDAILWTLWGKTRFGSDTDVMHSGSSDMEVRLDFQINSYNYRIIRKRSKKGKGFVSVLELQSLTEPITVLTDATISKTQERVNELIGVDYELLVSSAFLRQGDAAEFTHKSPSKRKELLSSILHLDQYQRWHEETKLELKEIESSLLATQGQREYLLSEKNRLQSEIAALEKELSDNNVGQLEKLIEETQAEIKKQADSIQSQKEKAERIKLLQSSFEQTNKKLQQTQKKLDQLTIQKNNAQSNGTDVKPIDHDLLQHLTNELEKLQKDLAQKEAINQTIVFLEKQLAQLTSQYSNSTAILQKELTRLESLPAVLAAQAIPDHNISELQTNLQKTIEETNQKLISYSEKIATLDFELNATVSSGNAIKEKKQKLEQLDHNCPLCEQAIDDNHKREIAEKYETERAQLLAHYNDIKQQKEIVEANKKTTQTELEQQRARLAEINKAAEGTILITQLQNLHLRLQQEAETYKSQHDSLEQSLHDHKAQVTALSLNLSQFDTTKEQVNKLQKQDALYRKHQELALTIKSLEKEIELLELNVQAEYEEQTHIQHQIQAIQAELSPPGNEETALTKSQERLKLLEEQQEEIKQRQTQLAHLKKDCERIEDTLTTQEQQDQELLKNRETLTVLAEALSYRGIPTMIIEEAIPRLEQYANDILSFLSDNTMSVRFSLSRTSKTDKDNQIETLDILIGDTFGTRAYELFSGGEAFRIDIALRLALTKLLTERSNGKIDFLVIDEGFGSQDESGKDHVMQIIHKLERYFKLIIIITHVDSLKETFPDRLLVKKGPYGSEVMVDQED